VHKASQLARARCALILLTATLTGACASVPRQAGVVPVPRPFPGAPVPDRAPAGNDDGATTERVDGSALVAIALGFRGTPYRNGGTDPRSGFDCSGFTQYVFGQYGIALPREVVDQYKVGRAVKPRDLQAGDLIFFSTVSRGASHVAIALGDDQFVHAPSSRGVVRVERLSSSYWGRRFVGARRVEGN
jgi:peptidoglycan DL-endopeptidase CwlO